MTDNQVKEFSDQAKASIPKDVLDPDSWIQEYNRIFAELIVCECARVADEGMSEVTMYVRWPSHHIKKHFGME